MHPPSRLARLLWVIGAVQASAIAMVLAWASPERSWLGLAAALLIAGIAPLILGLEFLLLAVVSPPDPQLRRPAPRRLLRAWWSEVGQQFRVFHGRMPFAWRTPPDLLDASCAGRTGVVLLHGFFCNRGFWAPWLRQLRSRGRACVAVNLEPVFGSIDDCVPLVAQAVRQVTERTGRPPVLVCHSMGGLVARAWLRSEGAADLAAHVVTIATPHRGTWLARFSRMPSGRQMRQHSEWLQELERSERERALPAFTCWWSDSDNIVFPVRSATLPGADNRLLPGQAHVAMAFHPELVDECLALIEATDLSKKEVN
jgi:pimeloyl-ACP methyl ester carboxylesterase